MTDQSIAGPVDAMKAQCEATSRLVESLADGDFAQDVPSCPGWQVRDVLIHLAGAASAIAGALKGDTDLLSKRDQVMQELANVSPAQLKQACIENNRQLQAAFDVLRPDELTSKKAVHPQFGEVPVMTFVSMRTCEATVHAWDIQSALNPDVKLASPGVGVTLGYLSRAWPNWFLPDQVAGMSRTYGLISGDFERRLSIGEGKAVWAEGSGPPDVAMWFDPGDLVLLMAGRVSSEKLVGCERVKVEGDQAAAGQLSRLFKAYAGR